MLPGLASSYSTLLTRPFPPSCRGCGSAQAQGNRPQPFHVIGPKSRNPSATWKFWGGWRSHRVGSLPCSPQDVFGEEMETGSFPTMAA